MAHPPTMGFRRPRPGARHGVVALMAAGAVLIGSCSTGDPTPPEVAGPPTTVPPIQAPVQLPDTRAVALAGVAGTAPPSEEITVRGGDADLVGVVQGPDGPVAGATVLFERFVGDQRTSLDVRTDRRGQFRALDVFGGRYRIRAWSSPTLALTTPMLEFVRDDKRTIIDLTVTSHDGLNVQAVATTTSPLVDESVTVTALVTDQTVDERGIVTAPPATGQAVRLTTGASWRTIGSAVATADTSGRATWTVTCVSAGPSNLTIAAGTGATATIGTACRNPVASDDEQPDDPAPEPDFAVGETFTPPFESPLPAGTYAVTDSAGSCGISFERYVEGAWETIRRTATGTIEFSVATPFRDVRAIGDSPPCTYERVA